MSVIALDIGKKNIGIAIETKGIAFPLEIVPRGKLVSKLQGIISQRGIHTIVIGLPYKNDNSNNTTLEYIKKLSEKLEGFFPHIHFSYIDERFTTQIVRTQNTHKKDIQKHRDDESACFILETFLSKEKLI